MPHPVGVHLCCRFDAEFVNSSGRCLTGDPQCHLFFFVFVNSFANSLRVSVPYFVKLDTFGVLFDQSAVPKLIRFRPGHQEKWNFLPNFWINKFLSLFVCHKTNRSYYH